MRAVPATNDPEPGESRTSWLTRGPGASAQHGAAAVSLMPSNRVVIALTGGRAMVLDCAEAADLARALRDVLFDGTGS